MSNYTVNNINVNALISWIEQDIVALPEIQRPFVWKPTKVRDLLDSLYHDYPVGYIITWQSPDAKLKDGGLSQGKRILIDGQQRMTALRAAITGREVVTKEYATRPIRIAFHPIEQRFEVQNPAIQKDKKWIPDISKVFSDSFNDFEFIRDYCEKNEEIGNNELNNILQRLKRIIYSSIGVIELSHELDIERVTEIFIRINSAGVNLSQADFAMSKISVNNDTNGPLIRKMIDYFCHTIKDPSVYKNIKENDWEFAQREEFKKMAWVKDYNTRIYEPKYSDLLRVAFTYKFLRGKISNLVSLLSGRDFETREYKNEIIEDSFMKLYDAVLFFINETNFKRFIMILKSAGVINPKIVRSQNAINFAYALYLLLKEKRVSEATINRAVKKWLLISILTERYSSSPESQFDFDIKRFDNYDDPMEYIATIEAGELSQAYWDNIMITNLDTSVTSSPYFNLFIMAQIYDKDQAFLSKSVTVPQLIEERGDVHHIFPKKYLQKNGYDNRKQYNQIANYVYTEQSINLAIKAQAPNEYMNKVEGQLQDGKMVIGEITDREALLENLRMNCVPEDIFNMTVEDYPRFLTERRKLIVAKIKRFYDSL